VDRGYGQHDVNVMMSDETRRKCFGESGTKKVAETELGNKALEGVGVGAGVGAVTGGILAAIAAAATVAVPGVSLVVAGPIAAALAGAGAGGVTGSSSAGIVPSPHAVGATRRVERSSQMPDRWSAA
jgi:hypothetical protein